MTGQSALWPRGCHLLSHYLACCSCRSFVENALNCFRSLLERPLYREGFPVPPPDGPCPSLCALVVFTVALASDIWTRVFTYGLSPPVGMQAFRERRCLWYSLPYVPVLARPLGRPGKRTLTARRLNERSRISPCSPLFGERNRLPLWAMCRCAQLLVNAQHGTGHVGECQSTL